MSISIIFSCFQSIVFHCRDESTEVDFSIDFSNDDLSEKDEHSRAVATWFQALRSVFEFHNTDLNLVSDKPVQERTLEKLNLGYGYVQLDVF